MKIKTNSPKQIVHLARYQRGAHPTYLLLYKEGEHYVWYQRDGKATGIQGENVNEAIAAARNTWKEDSFRTVNCGFRYTLPERDEHGNNALFCQMIASYSTPNGVYFDEELGHNCYVDFASQEATNLWRDLG